jgi:hypothetical protein
MRRIPCIIIALVACAASAAAQTPQPPEGNPCQGEDIIDANPNMFTVESDQIGRLPIAEVVLTIFKGTPLTPVGEPEQTIRVAVGKLTKTLYPNCWSGPFAPKADLIADGKTLYSVFFRLVDSNGFISPVKPGVGSPFVLGSVTQPPDPTPVPEPLRAPNGRVGRTGA